VERNPEGASMPNIRYESHRSKMLFGEDLPEDGLHQRDDLVVAHIPPK